jgi:membrane associated rhomboid family serine protease
MSLPPPATPSDETPSRMVPAEPAPAVPVCYRHPKRETYIRCVRCDRSICPECMNEAAVGFQCPECVADGRRTQRPARTAFGGSGAGAYGYVTKVLVGINVVVMVVSVALVGGGGLFGGGFGGLLGGSTPLTEAGSVFGLARYRNMATGAIVHLPDGVADGQFYRLFTSMFLHYGVLHLLLNMWALWVLGRELEARLGSARFLLLYLLAGLGGSVACYVFTPAAHAAGASGAIYGLFAALFVVFRRLNLSTTGIVTVLVINLIFSFSAPNISIAAHLGGLVIGAIVGVALAYPPRQIRNRVLAAAVAGVVLVLAAAVTAQTLALNSTVV